MAGIVRKRGDTYPIQLTLRDANGAVNLTGATDLALGVSDKSHADLGGGSRLVELPGTIADAAGGVASFAMTPEQAAVLQPGVYSYDVSFKLAGVVFTTPTFAYKVAGRIASVPA